MKLLIVIGLGLFSLLTSCSRLPFESVRPPHPFFQTSWAKSFDPVYNTGNLPISLGSPLVYGGVLE